MTLRADTIEAMARAICFMESKAIRKFDCPSPEHLPRAMWDNWVYRNKAIAALAAQQSVCTPLGIKLTAREPTEVQVDAARSDIPSDFDRHDIADALRYAHDAAPDLLEETK